ncbi:MAG: hypothetical protein LBQ74_05060 [Prevotella sp.]|jgi:hypothetical protein|nr:hypothetical protein [Prevotella sp.]
MTIKGGYILQPRAISESAISKAPPCVRETWAYLIREANSSQTTYAGHTVKRGQLFRNYREIREALSWTVGARIERYSEAQVKHTMNVLRIAGRITTRKYPRGILITICNYDYYQNPDNYEGTTGIAMKSGRANHEKSTDSPSINKNDNKNIDIDKSISCRIEEKFSFEQAWQMYGKKGNRKTSERRWASLKNHCRELAFRHIPLYVESTPDRQYRKNFETYISQEAWNDELSCSGSLADDISQPRFM